MPIVADCQMAIGITIYKPDFFLLEQLLSKVEAMSSNIFLHIDGPLGEAICEEGLYSLQAKGFLSITQSDKNEGIAAALNKLALEACRHDCGSILYFDQDSDPASNLSLQLTDALNRLEEEGQRPAVIGPRPTTNHDRSSKPPHYRIRRRSAKLTDCQAVDYVITSGSLIRLSALKELGLFREEYRIDAVDTEWCFRAWSKGCSVWMFSSASMPHRIGSGLIRIGPLIFPRQNLSRMHTYITNQARMLRLPYIPLRWKLRTLFYVPLQCAVYAAFVPKRLGIFRLFLTAAWSGLSSPPSPLKMPIL